MKKRLFMSMATVLISLFATHIIYAQTVNDPVADGQGTMITGCVVDQYGNPFGGKEIKVTVKGTDKTAYVDADGVYSIEAKASDSLAFVTKHHSDFYSSTRDFREPTPIAVNVLKTHNVTITESYPYFGLSEKKEYKPKFHISVADEFMFGHTSAGDERRNEIARICSLP